MILTANYDESGTHQGSPLTVLAGFAATDEQWIAFNREWSKVLRNHSISHLRAKHLFHRQGQHKGWSRQQMQRLWNDILYVLQEQEITATKTILREEEYKIFYISDGKERRERLDSRYALCFRSLLQNLPRVHTTRYFEDHVNFVLEAGHRNMGDAARVHQELKSTGRINDAIGSLKFGDKKGSCALQAADMLAYTCYSAECQMLDEERGWITGLESELLESKLTIVEHLITIEDLKILRKNFLRKRKLDFFNKICIDGQVEELDADSLIDLGRAYYPKLLID